MQPPDNHTGRREHRRVRIALQVSYRSAGSFLVSYSVDLSQGGLFIETPRPREVGTELELWLTIPGATQDVRLRGTVVWIRTEPEADLPAGMGVQFQEVESDCGHLIDQLVRHFAGLRCLVASPSARVRGQLGRMLRAAMMIHVEEHDLEEPFTVDPQNPYDLVVVDLADGDTAGQKLLDDIVTVGDFTAVVALASHPSVRQRALDSGAHAVVNSPPGHAELRMAVLRTLGRPLALPADELEDP